MESIRNLFRSRLSMRTSAMLVNGHMKAHRIVYTHLALVRPDVIYQTPLVFDPTNTRAQVRVPDWGHDFCPNCVWAGVNDRFAIGELPVLLPLALERLVQLSRYSIVRNSEHLWCAVLAEAKVTVGLLHGMRLIRTRAHGKERRDQKPALPLPPLLCVQRHGLKLVQDWNDTMSEGYAQSISSQPSCSACFPAAARAAAKVRAAATKRSAAAAWWRTMERPTMATGAAAQRAAARLAAPASVAASVAASAPAASVASVAAARAASATPT